MAKVIRKKKQSFLTKNIKWISLVLLVLLMLKSIQSCSRKNSITLAKNETIVITDSLNRIILGQDSIIRELQYGLKSAIQDAKWSDKRAQAIQDAVQKFKTNSTTTIKIETIKDTTTKDKIKVSK